MKSWSQQGFKTEKQPRILILLDGSSSMLQQWTKDEQRFKTAGRIITTLIDSVYGVNNEVEFGLRLYGHQSPVKDNNCFDTKKEVIFSKDNLTQMSLRLDALHPYGVSPIAYSLKQAALEDLVDLKENKYSLILITDGGESCEGDICAVVEELLRKKIDFKPYIVSLVDYAPLREQYKCLGEYLLVKQEADIPVVVNKIVNAYRKTFINPIASTTIKTDAASTAINTRPQPKIIQPKIEEPEHTPVVKEEPAPVPVVKTEPTPVPIVKAEPEQPKSSGIIVQQEPEVKKLKKDTIDAIVVSNDPKKLSQKIVTQSITTTTVPDVTPEPIKEPEQPKPVYKQIPQTTPQQIRSAPVTTPNTIAANKKPEYSVEEEEAKETTLQIFFTNGKGKYYESTPKLVLVDANSGKEVKTFYRTIMVNGDPDPQNIMPGTYHLKIAGKDNMLTGKPFIVNANKNEKIKIVVGKSSLRFEYVGHPERPVSEFSVEVDEILVPGPIYKQKCTERVEYDPGSYRITYNTLPPIRQDLDVYFGAEYVLRIDVPGFLQITNTNNLGKIALYYTNGDRFKIFHTVNVTGNLADQKVRLQPGRYRLSYRKNPQFAATEDKVMEFMIKSDTITEINIQ